MIDILYEDKQIIVCIKPPGMLSASGKEETSVDMVLQKHREEAGEAGFIGVAHRLDSEDTGGSGSIVSGNTERYVPKRISGCCTRRSGQFGRYLYRFAF